MTSVHKEESLRPRPAARKPDRPAPVAEPELEEEEDPVVEYLQTKKRQELLDSCLWFSRGMHHVHLPGTQLHTAVHDAERDEYIAVTGHGGKWQRLLHHTRRFLSRATMMSRVTSAQQADDVVNGNVRHAHLCIVSGKNGGQKRFETMKLVEALQWCDSQGLAAYVECCDVADLDVYLARGFRVVQTVDEVKADCARLYALWRVPRSTG